MRRKVDFPQPDGPISAVTQAGGAVIVTSASTLVVPNQAATPSASRLDPDARGTMTASSVAVVMNSLAVRPDLYAIPSPTIGALRCVPPAEPKKRASPKVKIPPSEATSQ